MTTALVIALQYFCSDRALFNFERTPRTFWISIAILMPSLVALSMLLHTVDHYRSAVMQRVYGMKDAAVRPAAIPHVSLGESSSRPLSTDKV